MSYVLLYLYVNIRYCVPYSGALSMRTAGCIVNDMWDKVRFLRFHALNTLVVCGEYDSKFIEYILTKETYTHTPHDTLPGF